MGRILAIDFGTKRFGIAVSDETKKIAFPRRYILAAEKEALLNLIRGEGIELILIGLPRNLQGEETGAANKARDFGKWLERQTDLPMRFIDERYTTRESRSKLQEAGVKSRQLKERVDSMSAYVLLEAYLKKLKG